jgi:phage anti-repressor protein
MNELIEVSKNRIGEDSVNSVSARELHKVLEVKKDFSDWIKVQIRRGMFDENIDYTIVWSNPLEGVAFLTEAEILKKFSNSHRARAFGWSLDYILTLETAKHISLMSETQKGKELRNYFIEIEKRFQKFLHHSSWIEERQSGKEIRREFTDIIQSFVSYAKSQGSENGERYYKNFTNMIYLSLGIVESGKEITKDFRNELNETELFFVKTAEKIVGEIIDFEMKQKTAYKTVFQLSKEKLSSFGKTVFEILQFKERPRNNLLSLF